MITLAFVNIFILILYNASSSHILLINYETSIQIACRKFSKYISSLKVIICVYIIFKIILAFQLIQ
jgi:hypothetical protein